MFNQLLFFQKGNNGKIGTTHMQILIQSFLLKLPLLIKIIEINLKLKMSIISQMKFKKIKPHQANRRNS